MRRRRFLASATGLATAPLLAGPALAQAEGSRRLRFVPSVDLSTIDPLWSAAVVAYTHGYMVWDTLYGLTLDQQPKPQMCEGHEVADGFRTWTFRLRPGLKFHDGEPVRSADVVASVNRWMVRDTMGQMIKARLDALDKEAAALSLPDSYADRIYDLRRHIAWLKDRKAGAA